MRIKYPHPLADGVLHVSYFSSRSKLRGIRPIEIKVL